MNVTVRDYLFEGVEICKNGCEDDGFVAKMACGKIKDNLKVAKQMRLHKKDILFATFHYRNNTHQKYLTVNSGRQNHLEIGAITQLDNSSTMNVWNQFGCNQVSGLTGIFPINLGFKTTFQSFSAEICRPVKLHFSTIKPFGSIKGYKYVALNTTFNTSMVENQCYCTGKIPNLDGNLGCLYDGVLDLSTCLGL